MRLNMLNTADESIVFAFLYSTCTSATWVDCTVLLPLMVAGFTTPEKRTYSAESLIATCFSPATRRLPFGNTSGTVTVIAPENVLLPELSLALPDLTLLLVPALPPTPPVILASIGACKAILPVLESSWPDFPLAEVVSTILIVSTSPTLRARLSSNMGRSFTPAWKIEPLPDAATGLGSGRAVNGCLMLVEGTHAARDDTNTSCQIVPNTLRMIFLTHICVSFCSI